MGMLYQRQMQHAICMCVRNVVKTNLFECSHAFLHQEICAHVLNLHVRYIIPLLYMTTILTFCLCRCDVCCCFCCAWWWACCRLGGWWGWGGSWYCCQCCCFCCCWFSCCFLSCCVSDSCTCYCCRSSDSSEHKQHWII